MRESVKGGGGGGGRRSLFTSYKWEGVGGDGLMCLQINFHLNDKVVSQSLIVTILSSLTKSSQRFSIQLLPRGHGGRVVTLSPPTSAAGDRSPSWP